MKFSDKNAFIIKHKSEKFFYKDLELFQKHFPLSSLNGELARANQFTRARLDGQMLNHLLDKVSPDDILQNREAETVIEPKPQPKAKVNAAIKPQVTNSTGKKKASKKSSRR